MWNRIRKLIPVFFLTPVLLLAALLPGTDGGSLLSAFAASHAQAPEVFRCAESQGAAGETVFSVLLGEDGFFDASGRGKNPDEMRNLPDRDIFKQYMIVERADPICWMKPDAELEIDAFRADGSWDLEKFGQCFRHAAGMNASYLGGDTRFVSKWLSEQELESGFLGLPLPEEEK